MVRLSKELSTYLPRYRGTSLDLPSGFISVFDAVSAVGLRLWPDEWGAHKLYRSLPFKPDGSYYYLDEESGWGLQSSNLDHQAIDRPGVRSVSEKYSEAVDALINAVERQKKVNLYPFDRFKGQLPALGIGVASLQKALIFYTGHVLIASSDGTQPPVVAVDESQFSTWLNSLKPESQGKAPDRPGIQLNEKYFLWLVDFLPPIAPKGTKHPRKVTKEWCLEVLQEAIGSLAFTENSFEEIWQRLGHLIDKNRGRPTAGNDEWRKASKPQAIESIREKYENLKKPTLKKASG